MDRLAVSGQIMHIKPIPNGHLMAPFLCEATRPEVHKKTMAQGAWPETQNCYNLTVAGGFCGGQSGSQPVHVWELK